MKSMTTFSIADGDFCLWFALFPSPAHYGKRSKYLVTAPYRNWKDAKAEFSKHVCLEYHKDSRAKMDVFIQIMTTPLIKVQSRLSHEAKKRSCKEQGFLNIDNEVHRNM